MKRRFRKIVVYVLVMTFVFAGTAFTVNADSDPSEKGSVWIKTENHSYPSTNQKKTYDMTLEATKSSVKRPSTLNINVHAKKKETKENTMYYIDEQIGVFCSWRYATDWKITCNNKYLESKQGTACLGYKWASPKLLYKQIGTTIFRISPSARKEMASGKKPVTTITVKATGIVKGKTVTKRWEIPVKLKPVFHTVNSGTFLSNCTVPKTKK